MLFNITLNAMENTEIKPHILTIGSNEKNQMFWLDFCLFFDKNTHDYFFKYLISNTIQSIDSIIYQINDEISFYLTTNQNIKIYQQNIIKNKENIINTINKFYNENNLAEKINQYDVSIIDENIVKVYYHMEKNQQSARIKFYLKIQNL